MYSSLLKMHININIYTILIFYKHVYIKYKKLFVQHSESDAISVVVLFSKNIKKSFNIWEGRLIDYTIIIKTLMNVNNSFNFLFMFMLNIFFCLYLDIWDSYTFNNANKIFNSDIFFYPYLSNNRCLSWFIFSFFFLVRLIINK